MAFSGGVLQELRRRRGIIRISRFFISLLVAESRGIEPHAFRHSTLSRRDPSPSGFTFHFFVFFLLEFLAFRFFRFLAAFSSYHSNPKHPRGLYSLVFIGQSEVLSRRLESGTQAPRYHSIHYFLVRPYRDGGPQRKGGLSL